MPYMMCSLRLANTFGTNSRKPRSGEPPTALAQREMTGSSV